MNQNTPVKTTTTTTYSPPMQFVAGPQPITLRQFYEGLALAGLLARGWPHIEQGTDEIVKLAKKLGKQMEEFVEEPEEADTDENGVKG